MSIRASLLLPAPSFAAPNPGSSKLHKFNKAFFFFFFGVSGSPQLTQRLLLFLSFVLFHFVLYFGLVLGLTVFESWLPFPQPKQMPHPPCPRTVPIQASNAPNHFKSWGYCPRRQPQRAFYELAFSASFNEPVQACSAAVVLPRKELASSCTRPSLYNTRFLWQASNSHVLTVT